MGASWLNERFPGRVDSATVVASAGGSVHPVADQLLPVADRAQLPSTVHVCASLRIAALGEELLESEERCMK